MKYEIEIEGTNLLEDKFNGKKEGKAIKEQPDSKQADAALYRLDNENIAIPGLYIRGCIIEYLVNNAGSKQKQETRFEVSPRIRIEPELIDLKTKEFKIDKRVVPVKQKGKIADMDYKVRPLIEKWKAKAILITTLEKTENEWKDIIKNAGIDNGIGAGRPLGFGRFKLLNLKKI